MKRALPFILVLSLFPATALALKNPDSQLPQLKEEVTGWEQKIQELKSFTYVSGSGETLQLNSSFITNLETDIKLLKFYRDYAEHDHLSPADEKRLEGTRNEMLEISIASEKAIKQAKEETTAMRSKISHTGAIALFIFAVIAFLLAFFLIFS